MLRGEEVLAELEAALDVGCRCMLHLVVGDTLVTVCGENLQAVMRTVTESGLLKDGS